MSKYFTTGVYSASKDVEEHLAMGKKLLAAGQLAEALSHYHAAVGKHTVHSVFKYILTCYTVFTLFLRMSIFCCELFQRK